MTKNDNNLATLEMTCGTCEFNFSETCTGGDRNEHLYGHRIVDENDSCSGWSCGMEYFAKTILPNKHLCKTCPNNLNEYCHGAIDVKMSRPRKRP